jgi:cell division septum initiation protein DivIVA
MQEELDKLKERNKKLLDNAESLAHIVMDKAGRNEELYELVRLFRGACIESREKNEQLRQENARLTAQLQLYECEIGGPLNGGKPT